MISKTRGLTLIGAVLIALLMVFVLPAGLAAASGPSGAGASQTLWAYGAARNISFQGTTASGWQYEGSATFGYAVILNEQNTSADGSTFELSLNRTMGVLLSAEACLPSCAHPVDEIQESYHAWETTYAWANFTLLGTVSEGSSTVPALALVNTNAAVSAHLAEHNSSLLSGIERTRALNVNVSGDAAVSFSGPLGLVPLDLNLSQPATWNSSSPFVAHGEGAWNYHFASTGPVVDLSVNRSGSIEIGGNGTVAVDGSYALGNSVTFGGVTYPAIQLTFVGPFAVREGIVFIPTGGDLFSGSSQPWSGNQSGSATVSQSALDILPRAGPHLGLVASAWLYSASGSSASSSAILQPTVSGVTTDAGSTAPVPPTTVQGEPQSISDAQQTQNCLATGSGCPASTTTTPAPFLPHGLFVFGIVVVVVVVIAAVLISERRRMPPPAYPNAKLYPPGTSAAAPPPAPSRPPGTAPPAPEDDPLSHLW